MTGALQALRFAWGNALLATAAFLAGREMVDAVVAGYCAGRWPGRVPPLPTPVGTDTDEPPGSPSVEPPPAAPSAPDPGGWDVIHALRGGGFACARLTPDGAAWEVGIAGRSWEGQATPRNGKPIGHQHLDDVCRNALRWLANTEGVVLSLLVDPEPGEA